VSLPQNILVDSLKECAQSLKNKGHQLDEALVKKLFDARKQAMNACQTLQEQRNKQSKEVGQMKAKKQDCSQQLAALSEVSSQLKEALDTERKADLAWKDMMLSLPNLPHKDSPIGETEAQNKVLRTWGEPKKFDFEPLDHVTLAKNLSDLNLEQGAELSGARFAVLHGKVAQLHRQLAQFMLNTHINEHGYTEVNVPLLVKEACLFGTGQLPKFRDDQFFIDGGSLALIPTAEVPITNLYRNTILNSDQLPLKFVAHTPCFRKEAGSAGKDTHGLFRMHQFEKVELVQITTEALALQAHQEILQQAEAILQRLELPYRVVDLCTGDLGFAANRTYDLEVWLPSQNTYREIASISHFDTFQARRMQTRHRQSAKDPIHYVHTLNGSGLAVGRTLIAFLENHQNNKGQINPEILQLIT
jgi:seryl-tRNA synthetase